MLMLGRYERDVCECGFHQSLITPENHFTFDVDVCPVCKAAAQFARKQAREDEVAVKALGENPDPITPRPMDGRHTTTRFTGTVEQWRASRSRADQSPARRV